MKRRVGFVLGMAAVVTFPVTVSARTPERKPFTTADVEALVKVCRDVLSGRVTRFGQIEVRKLPKALTRHFDHDISFTLFHDRAPLMQYSGHARNVIGCAYAMMKRAAAMPGHLFYGFNQSDRVGFFIEFVTDRELVKPTDWHKRLKRLDMGVEGIEIEDRRKPPPPPKSRRKRRERPSGTKTEHRFGSEMPGRAVIGELDSRDRFILRLCERIRLYPSKRPVMPEGTYLWDKKTTRVYVLRTQSFLVMPGHTRAREMFRVNLPASPPAPETLIRTVRTAADYLCRHQESDGRFLLSYRPSTGRLS